MHQDATTARLCLGCQSPLTGRQEKYCSRQCYGRVNPRRSNDPAKVCEAMKRMYQHRREAGLCYKCGTRQPEPGYKTCLPCLEKQRHYASYGAPRYRAKLRGEVLAHYGASCACCGESEQAFLTIDHLNGGGRQHRIELGLMSGNFYVWLRKGGFPDGYQTLCWNCNFAKHAYGKCPHQG